MANPQQEALEHVLALVHDRAHFSARWLAAAREKTGLDEEHVAAGAAVVLGGYLLAGARAQFVCNLLLVGCPLLVTYVFPKERPPVDQLLVYWASFGSLSLLDLGFEEFVPAYYLLKALLLALLFVRPFRFAAQAVELLRVLDEARGGHAFDHEQLNEAERKAGGRKSPPPEKPEHEDEKLIEKGEKKGGSTRTVHRAESTPAVEQADDSAPVQTARTRTPRQEADGGRDAMLRDSVRFALTEGASNEEGGVETHGANAPVNLHDFVTRPLNKLVFNAPFGDNVLQYHMTVMNNTPRTMAFAVKSNAIPRLTANPPVGVLKPRQQLLVWVNVQPFDPQQVDVSRDRIAFDYVFCPPETRKFSFSLFQSTETRRRKNLRIEYNP